MRLDKAKDCSIQNTWKLYHHTSYWCNLTLAHEKGLVFYDTRSHAIVFYDTLPAVCIEKVLCKKTGWMIMNINSNNFLKTRNYPKCAPTQV